MITIDELRKLNGRISYTPVGVVRLVFREKYMYHFFSDQAPPVLIDNIHTHPHSFKSIIKKGGIRNHVYRYEKSEDETEYNLASRLYPGRAKATLKIEENNINFNKVLTFDTLEGGSYNINHTTMHEIELLAPKVVTLLNCSPYIGAMSKVLFIMKKDTVYTKEQLFNLKTEKECWEIVEYTLA